MNVTDTSSNSLVVVEHPQFRCHIDAPHDVKVEIILKEREVAFLSPGNMPSTFEFFYCAPEKFKC